MGRSVEEVNEVLKLWHKDVITWNVGECGEEVEQVFCEEVK
jgi:hypothetical protein